MKKLQKYNPNAKLAYLGYYQCEKVPQTIRPQKGVFLEYAPFTRNMKKSAQAVSDETKENMRLLLQYFGKEDSWALEYFYDNSYFSNWDFSKIAKFVPNNDMIKADVAYIRTLALKTLLLLRACSVRNMRLFTVLPISVLSENKNTRKI